MSHDAGQRDVRKRTPRVTVLMPVHNGGDYLQPCVESILGQTFTDFEFFIVDDASTDATPAYLSSVSDSRVRVLRNEKKMGTAFSANRAIGQSTGEYIARQDADDLSEPTRLARQVEFLDAAPEVAVVATAAIWIDEADNIIDHYCPTKCEDLDVRWQLLFRNILPHSSVMARRTVFASGYSESVNFATVDDYELLARIARDHRVVVFPDELVRYRMHASSMSQVHHELQVRQAAAIAFREVCALTEPRLAREVYEDFLVLYRGGGSVFPALSEEQVRAATEFAAKLQVAFYTRSGPTKSAAWRHCAKVRFRWAGHLLRLALCERRDVRWRASLVITGLKLMCAPVIRPAKADSAMRAVQ